jgi:hypothetical protein
MISSCSFQSDASSTIDIWLWGLLCLPWHPTFGQFLVCTQKTVDELFYPGPEVLLTKKQPTVFVRGGPTVPSTRKGMGAHGSHFKPQEDPNVAKFLFGREVLLTKKKS